MQIRLNGEIRNLERQATLEELLKNFGIEKDSVVCELNKKVVHKETYEQVILQENDSLEIVRFVGGG